MSCTITLNKTFDIELEDNTTISIMVCLEASTQDEDYQASQQIQVFTYRNILTPLQEALTNLLGEIEEEEDIELDPQDDGGIDDLLTIDHAMEYAN